MSIDMTLQKWAILKWGSMGKFLIFCRIQLKFRFWLYKKTLTHIMKLSARKKQVIKKVIAKKPLTNLYEMNSKYLT